MGSKTGFIITDDAAKPPKGFARGLIERDYRKYDVGYNSKPFDLKIIPRDEWVDRWNIIKAANAQLSLVRATGNNGKRIPSTNQGRTNFCWAHSSTSGEMLIRAKQGEPHRQLSATAVACKIKNFRNVGGWGAQSLEYIGSHGVPDIHHWPEGIEGIKRHYDDPTTWKNAEQHQFTEWMDLEPRNVDQLMTCLLLGIPVVSDFNWWGHSVLTMDIRKIDLKRRNPIETRIWNSWADTWGEFGEGDLQESRAIPDGMIAPRVATGTTTETNSKNTSKHAAV